MKNRTAESDDLVGLIRVRQHCTFTWRRSVRHDQRSVDVFANHCADCIDEVRRRGYSLVFIDPEEQR